MVSGFNHIDLGEVKIASSTTFLINDSASKKLDIFLTNSKPLFAVINLGVASGTVVCGKLTTEDTVGYVGIMALDVPIVFLIYKTDNEWRIKPYRMAIQT